MPFHRRVTGNDVVPTPDRLQPMVRAIQNGEVRLEAIERILDALIQDPDVPAEVILTPYKSRPQDMDELARVLEEVTAQASGLAGSSADVRLRWGIGQVMRRFIGRLDPTVVHERLRETLETVGELG